jgi:hypothetical protein
MLPFRFSLYALAFTFAVSTALSERGLAAAAPLTPGEYILDGGCCGLDLFRTKGETTHFWLTTFGLNRVGCGLEGEIRKGLATLPTDLRDENGERLPQACEVAFEPTAGGVKVTNVSQRSNGSIDPCRFFCGVHAEFEAEYPRSPPECTSKARRSSRAKSQRLYAAKSYAQAARVLETLLDHCAQQMDNLETGWLRNDLAVTQYHLGRLAACRKTLAGLAEEAATTDDELRRSLLPNDFDAELPIVQAARHNLMLCRP